MGDVIAAILGVFLGIAILLSPIFLYREFGTGGINQDCRPDATCKYENLKCQNSILSGYRCLPDPGIKEKQHEAR